MVRLKPAVIYISYLPYFTTMSQNDNNKNDKRGLASADEETRKRVARKTGKA